MASGAPVGPVPGPPSPLPSPLLLETRGPVRGIIKLGSRDKPGFPRGSPARVEGGPLETTKKNGRRRGGRRSYHSMAIGLQLKKYDLKLQPWRPLQRGTSVCGLRIRLGKGRLRLVVPMPVAPHGAGPRHRAGTSFQWRRPRHWQCDEALSVTPASVRATVPVTLTPKQP